MYGWYAPDPRMRANVGIRRRLAPLLDNSRPEIELIHALVLSLPGSPAPSSGASRLARIARSTKCSSESGSRRCSATFTDP